MIHPGAWIAWATGAGLVAFLTTDPVYLLLLVGVSWFVYATHRIDGPEARAFRFFLLAALITLALRTSLAFIGIVSSGSVAFAFLEGLRLATILVVFGTFNAVTDPFGVVRLAPRRLHEPALAAALALSIAPRTVTSVVRVREAQRLRGINVSPLRSLARPRGPRPRVGDGTGRHARRIDGRSRARPRSAVALPGPAVVGARPSAIAVAAGASAAIFLSASFGGWAILHPSTTPFAWPPASPVLLGAIALLALPGLVRRGDRR